MDKLIKLRLMEFGMNVTLALERVAGNEQLLLLLLQALAEEKLPEVLKTAIQEQRVEEAFEIAHKLKGGIGNLALDTMYDIVVPLVEFLRQGNLDESAALNEVFYQKFCEFRELMILCTQG